MKTVFRLIAVIALVAAATPAAVPFRVGGLALDSPPKLSGDCGKSTDVHFNGRINANGSGDVTFQWVRSDNASSNPQTLPFSHSGPLTVTYDWHIKGSATGWVAIKVLSPNQVESNKVSFRINCRY